MKKRAHKHAQGKRRTSRSQASRTQRRGNLRWLIASTVCVAAFICLVGVASAASGVNSPGQAAKNQSLQQLINTGKAHIAPKAGIHHQAQTARLTPARQAGITNMRQGPFPASVFTTRNFWQGPVGNDWVLAYAGAKTRSDGTVGPGGLTLYTEMANTQGGFDLRPLGTFLAPNGTAALTITAVDGTILQLSSESGSHLAFDLVTHQFQ